MNLYYCKLCGNKKRSEKQRLSHEYVAQYYKDQGCELLDTYQRSRIPMTYRCCCGNISKGNWNNFMRGKRCQECLRVKRSGPNNYQWITDREAKKEYEKFKQRCYKVLKIVLHSTRQKKSSRTEQMLGYTIKEFHNHIINHPNWPKVKDSRWHVDHIFPIKAFADYGITDVKLINCLDNLQPLCYKDNISKSSKYNYADFEKWLKTKGAIT